MQIVRFDNKGFEHEWAEQRNHLSVIFIEGL